MNDQPSNPIKVLLLDDDAALRASLADILAPKGFEPLTAGTGQAAMEIVQREEIAVALIDLNLEDMPGLEALRGIKQRSPHTECILLTAYASRESAIQALQAGAHSYLQKPFDIELLLLTLQRAAEKQRAARALAQSEALFRPLTEMASYAVFVYQGERFIYVNPASIALTGYSQEELLSMRFWDLVHPDFRDLVRERGLARQRGEDAPAHYEFKVVRKDGQERWADFTASLIEWQGKPAVLGTAFDVTERRQVAERMRLQSAALEASANAIVIADRQAVIQWANPAFSVLTGYPLEEVIGKTPRDLVKSGIQGPEFYRALWDTILSGRVWRGTLVNRRKDGMLYDEEMTITPILDASGQPQYFIAVKEDISARRLAEEALRASARRYAALVEASPAGIFRTDVQGKATYVSPRWCQLTGLEAASALRDGWLQAVHPEDRERLAATWQAAVEKGNISTAEYRFLRPDGSICWVRGQAMPESDTAGQVSGYVGVLLDITEEKEAERALQERVAQLNALSRASQAVSASLDLDITLHEIVALSKEVGGAASASVLLLDEGGRPIGGVENLLGVPLLEGRIRQRGFTRWIVEHRQPLLVSRVGKNGRIYPPPPSGAPRSLNPAVRAAGIQSVVGLPLMAEERVVGILYLHSERPAAFDGQIPLLTAFANQAALALQKARLYHAAQIELEERKRAERSLRESETRYRQLVEQVPMVIYRDALDEQATSLFVGAQIEQLTGYSPDEWLANPNLWIESLHPEDRERVLAENRRHIETKEPFRCEYRLRRRDGRFVWVRDEAIVVHDQDGRPLYAQGLLEDITARKEAEEQLRQLKEFNEGIVQNLAGGIVVTDAMGVITYINPALSALLGYEPHELIGRLWLDLVPPDQQSIALAAEERRQAGQSDRHELRLQRKDGEAVWCAIGGSPRYDPQHGTFSGTIGVITDISARVQAEAEARRRVEEMSALYETTRDLAAQQDLNALLHAIVERARALLRATGGGIYLYDPARGDLEMAVSIGVSVSPGYRLKLGEGMAGHVAQSRQPLIVDDYQAWDGRVPRYASIPFRAVAQAPMLYDGNLIGVLAVNETGGSARKFTPQDLDLLTLFAHQAALAVGKARLYEESRQRVSELEVLYESGLVLSSLLDPQEIGRKIVQILSERLNWHHAVVRVRQPDSDALEVIGYNAPGLRPEDYQDEIERLNRMIGRVGQGMTGWVIQHGQTVRCNDLSADPHYVETYPGIRSGLYAPMKVGDEILGAIGVESESETGFDAEDERLLDTLAAQAAVALQAARQFQSLRRRAVELETLNRVSVALRAVSQREQMLAVALEEILHALETTHGAISLWDEASQSLRQVIARGWASDIVEAPIWAGEGIFGAVFSSGKTYLSEDFSADSATCEATRAQLPAGWGGACVPIQSSDKTLGVLLVCTPSKRPLGRHQARMLNTIAEMIGAALQRLALHEQTMRRLENLQAIHIVDQAISASFDLRPVLEIVLNQAISRLDMDAASILLLDPISQSLKYAVGRGFLNPDARRSPVRLGQGLAGRAALERLSLRTSSLEEASKETLRAVLLPGEAFEEYYVVPLIVKGNVKGVLEVFRREPLTLDSDQKEFLETLAGQAAIAIDNNQLFSGMQRANLDLAIAYDATIEGWSRALDLRDKETEGHTQRVTSLTLQLASRFNLSAEELNHIRRGALLHDIGKMGIPDSILFKPGPLSEEEWALMRRHPQLAYEMLFPITYLRPALDIPWCHHEKWDGSGYPRGLQGEQIPLAARMFAVVDVYDALTSDRPYRQAWPEKKVLEYLAEQSGKHFDPQIVERFLQMLAESQRANL